MMQAMYVIIRKKRITCERKKKLLEYFIDNSVSDARPLNQFKDFMTKIIAIIEFHSSATRNQDFILPYMKKSEIFIFRLQEIDLTSKVLVKNYK